MLESLSYPQFGPELSHAWVGLLNNVKNATQIRSRIVAAATAQGEAGTEEREAMNFAFIDATTLTGREHLLAAIYVALVAASHDILITKTIHSEILWALNYSNNISEAIRRFGISDKSTSVVVVRVGGGVSSPSDESIQKAIETVVEGTWAPLAELSNLTDWSLIRKYYKLNGDPAVTRLSGKLEDQNGHGKRIATEIVVSSVAMKIVLA